MDCQRVLIMEAINGADFKQNFGGKVIVYPRSSAKKQLKEFAKQYNQMNVVKNSPYNIYIAKGNNVWNDALTVRVLAKHGKCDDIELLRDGVCSCFSRDNIEYAVKKAVMQAQKKSKQKQGKIRFFLKNLKNYLTSNKS